MNDIVTILVKDTLTSKKFLVHKAFAVHYSPVFKSAFNSNLKEGQTQTYELEDTTEGAVQLLVAWSYTQKLNLNELEEETNWLANDLCLANLWVLADKLLIRPLQNAAMNELGALCARHKMLPTPALNYVFNNTQEGSPLRRFFVYKCAQALKPSCYTRFPEHFPKEMLLELAVYLTKAMDDLPRKPKSPKFRISDYEVRES
jgi:hypothetical protein